MINEPKINLILESVFNSKNEEINTKKESEFHDQNIAEFGLNVSAAFGISDIACAKNNIKYENNKDVLKNGNTQINFFRKISNLTFSRYRIKFGLGGLKLIDTSLRELEVIYNIWKHNKKFAVFNVKQFIKKYGTDFDIGYYFFGGFQQISTTIEGFEEKSRTSAMETVQQELTTQMKISYESLNIEAKNSLKNNKTLNKEDNKSELKVKANTEKKIFGGEIPNTQINDWKNSLKLKKDLMIISFTGDSIKF